MHDPSNVFLTLGLALWVGIMALSLARWLKVPPLLFFIIAGVGLGPLGTGWLQPSSLGDGLSILVELGLAIMLFEAALGLPRSEPLPHTSRRLLGVGLPLTAIFSAITAHSVLGLGVLPSTAFGALIVVTGPTTIGPLLRSVPLGQELEKLLKNEAVWGDCLGIMLAGAILPLWINGKLQSLVRVPLVLLEATALSITIGGIIGLVLGKWLLPALARLGDKELPGMVALSFAIITFSVGELVMPGSGPIASAVTGFVLAYRKTPYLREIKTFKGQIAYVFISMLFVLLSGLFDPSQLDGTFLPIVLTALILGVVVRPASLGIAFLKTRLTAGERIFASFIGPRGIIALATASFMVTRKPEDPDARVIFAATFITILFSSTFATIMARPLAKLLKVRLPEYKTGIIIVGINKLSLALAEKFSGRVPVMLVDSDPEKVDSVNLIGVERRMADALMDNLYEQAAETGYMRILAMTPNNALNTMIVRHAEHIFGPNRVFQVIPAAVKDVSSDGHGLKKTIAFHEDFHMDLLDAPDVRWKLVETDEPGEGQWPIARLKHGGVRICRAGCSEGGPLMVLDTTKERNL